MTSTVTPTLAPLMLRLALFSMRTCELIFWYDNEYSYSNRVVDLMAYMDSQGVRNPGLPTPPRTLRERERPFVAEESLSQLSPQH